ncbi:MAG: PAS domain S-box protein [Desulfobulbaceae bacterium]|nr:MAG: PAS domain S-box protein [Desulfobulbaceae bacterium]
MQKSDDERSPLRKSLPEVTGELGSHLYLYQILDETPNGVMVVGLDHRVLYANPAANRLLGVLHRGILDTSLEVLLGPENQWFYYQIGQYFDNLTEIQRNRIRHEIQLETGADEKTILDAVLMYPPARPDYYLLYLIDITERKRLEGQLRRRNSFFNNLINSSVDGIIAADMSGKIILFNDAALSLLGYEEDLDGLESFHVTKLYREDMAYQIISRMRSDEFGGRGKLLHHEISVRHRDGHDIPVRFSGGIIYDNEKEVATFGIFTDLRAILKIEEDLEQTHNMLMQSEKMAGLGRLAAGVAHEINNPMSGIMLYANLIKEELGDDHQVSDDLDTIISEAERCKVIVADLLEFSHQTSYEMVPINFNEVVQKTLGILQNQPLYHNISVTLNLSPELLPSLGNAIRFNQVVMNLLVNAAQAMEGEGSLQIITRPRANSGVNEIIIKDSGVGIAEEHLEKVFDPFFTTKTTGEGTGLGLSVSYAIVKEHKGTIRVSSEQGKGTTFTLRFPAVASSLEEN